MTDIKSALREEIALMQKVLAILDGKPTQKRTYRITAAGRARKVAKMKSYWAKRRRQKANA